VCPLVHFYHSIQLGRVYRIFESASLSVVKISNSNLYVLVSILVGVTVLINILWSSIVGFDTEYIHVDIYRPVKDYIQCQYGRSVRDFMYAHIAFVSLLISAGVVLAILARNVPAVFNEAPYIATSVYNCSVLLAFLVPMVASQVGGREGAYLIRSYGVLIVVLSTCSILFIPKFHALFSNKFPQARTTAPIATITKQYNIPTIARPNTFGGIQAQSIANVGTVTVLSDGPDVEGMNTVMAATVTAISTPPGIIVTPPEPIHTPVLVSSPSHASINAMSPVMPLSPVKDELASLRIRLAESIRENESLRTEVAQLHHRLASSNSTNTVSTSAPSSQVGSTSSANAASDKNIETIPLTHTSTECCQSTGDMVVTVHLPAPLPGDSPTASISNP
jgi:hypothetical protein